MPRDFGKLHVYENCATSNFGKAKALKYNEQYYCVNGKRHDTWDDKAWDGICNDWPKCRNYLGIKK